MCSDVGDLGNVGDIGNRGEVANASSSPVSSIDAGVDSVVSSIGAFPCAAIN
jgi:hypothetical protein